MFCNTSGRFLNPESSAQLFDRIVQRSDLARIRFHDLRHTHASLLVADGVAIEVVSERLGHAHEMPVELIVLHPRELGHPGDCAR